MPVKKNVTHAEILLFMEKRVLNRALVHSNKLAAYDAETAAQHHAMAKKLIDNERKQAQMTKAILRSQDAKLTAAHNAEINQPKVWMSHKLVESAHRLDVNEKRLMALAASKIDPEFDSRNLLTITKDEFAEVFFKDNSDYAYKALRDAAISISNKDINWRDSSLNRSGNLKWVYSCEYYSDAMKNGCHTDENAHVKIGISPPIVEHLQSEDGGKFLFYKLIEFAKLKTVYGQRLFELLMKFADTGFLTINIKDFLLAMEVPEGYLKDDGMPKDFGNINKRVLRAAVKDVAKNFTVKVKPIRIGKAVSRLEFTFKRQRKFVSRPADPVMEYLDRIDEIALKKRRRNQMRKELIENKVNEQQ